jgi:hypothetical protein
MIVRLVHQSMKGPRPSALWRRRFPKPMRVGGENRTDDLYRWTNSREPPQELRHVDDFSLPMLAQYQQVFVPRDEHIRFGIDGQSQQVVVAGISTDVGDLRWNEQLSSPKKIREFIGVSGIDQSLEYGPAHDFIKLVDCSR